MDDQFKRVMNIKTVPVGQPQSVDVTELRAELRKEIDELKSYVKGRDKVNKDAIKKMEERIADLFSNIVTGREPDKIYSVQEFFNLGEDGIKDYVMSNLVHTKKVGIESEVFVDFDEFSEQFLFYHKNFLDTISNVHNNEYEWLEYIQSLNDYPMDGYPSGGSGFLFFTSSAVLLKLHLDRYKTHLDYIPYFCLIDLVSKNFEMYLNELEGIKHPSIQKIDLMVRDRDNWLPLKAVLYNFAHQEEILRKLEDPED